jgi:soluble lytic murein transglycosylase-like protein
VRVVDDESVLEPEPPAAAAAASEPPVPLRFEAAEAKVPEGPFGAMIFETARRHSVNPQVVAALIRAESAGNPWAVSRKGARGLMQLMPATAERFGTRKEKLYDPKANLEAGIRYLSWLVEQFPGDLSKVLAAYNAGENTVLRYGGIPPYRETRDYIRRIYSTLGLTITGL